MPASAKLEFLGEELAALYDSLSEEEKELAWLNFEQTTELLVLVAPRRVGSSSVGPSRMCSAPTSSINVNVT